MTLDTYTILVTAGAVVGISGVTFIVNTVLRQNSEYGRLWSLAFIAGILETVSYLVWAAGPGAWWAASVGNGALVLALAFMWSGCRVYNSRSRSFAWLSVVAGVVVVLVSLAPGPDGGAWSGAAEVYAGVAVFSGLAGWETLRGALARTANGRVLTVVFTVVAVYYAARFAVFLAFGDSSAMFLEWFGTVTTTFIAIVLVVVAAISMSVLQPGAMATRGARSDQPGVVRITGVATVDDFEEQATDWLARARRDREDLVLLDVEIDNLPTINTAFGREVGDDAIRLVGRLAAETAPSAALVGYLGRARYLVLTTKPVLGEAADIAEHMQTALVLTPVDPEQGVRAIASFGIATTDAHGYALDELVVAAHAAVLPGDAVGAVAEAAAPPTGDASGTE